MSKLIASFPGIDKDSVTAGLIGGRVGNKGGGRLIGRSLQGVV
jgi:hypothetical protein